MRSLQRNVFTRALALAVGGLALLSAAPGLAAEQGVATITFESELWALNGDTVRQPMVPEIQKLDVPGVVVTDTLTVTPSVNNVTQVANFKADFAGGTTVMFSKTTMGNTILLANPTNRFDPFTGMFTVMIRNQQGTAMGKNPWTAEVPVDLTTDICLDERDSGGCFFVANIVIPGALGDPKVGNPTFTGEVAILQIPIEGTAFPQRFTTGTATVMTKIITKRRNNDPAGTPTGYKTFTFTEMGSATPMKLVFVSPVVVNAFAGLGPNRIPIPIVGFARATNVGFTYDVPEPGTMLLVASLAGLALLGRRRLRRA